MSFQSINTVVFEPIKIYRKLYVLHKTQIASVFFFFFFLVQRIGSLNTVLISTVPLFNSTKSKYFIGKSSCTGGSIVLADLLKSMGIIDLDRLCGSYSYTTFQRVCKKSSELLYSVP